MRGLPFLTLLAAGAVALPHRMVPSRRAAPSLAALDASLSALKADVDKLNELNPPLASFETAPLVSTPFGGAH